MNSRRFMCASLGEITPYHTIAREQVLCITAKLIVEWQTWVQTRSFGDVCSMSALDRFSDSSRTFPEVRVVPILLQKSFCTGDQKFSGL